MGYESRLYIVNPSSCKTKVNGKDKHFAEVIATFNLCVADDFLIGQIKQYPETDSFIYVNDEPTYTDCYGDVINEIPLEDMIDILERDIRENPWRRLYPALGLLRGFWKSEWGNLVVLHYGY